MIAFVTLQRLCDNSGLFRGFRYHGGYQLNTNFISINFYPKLLQRILNGLNTSVTVILQRTESDPECKSAEKFS